MTNSSSKFYFQQEGDMDSVSQLVDKDPLSKKKVLKIMAKYGSFSESNDYKEYLIVVDNIEFIEEYTTKEQEKDQLITKTD